MQPKNSPRFSLRSLTLATISLAFLILAGCAGEQVEPEPEKLARARVKAIVSTHAGEAVECPDYISDTRSEPGDEQVCFKSTRSADSLLRKILDELLPIQGGGPNANLEWTVKTDAAPQGDCDIRLIVNSKDYVCEDGHALLWVMDRAACDDGTLIVLLTTGRATTE